MAEWKDLPLTGPPYESAEESQLDEWAATVVDMVPIVIEGKLQLIKRPGLEEFFDLNTMAGIDGLYWHDKQRAALVVSGGRIWKITDATGTRSELTGSSALLPSAPVTFAKDATRAVMANGGQLVATDFSSLTTVSDADAPTAATHVADLDGYLLANNGNNQVKFSNINDLVNWNALDFFSAESDPDDVKALKVAFREIIALGNESVEFWVNDGTAPFSRIQGSAQPYGISAPYSLAQVGSTWIWLSDKRRLVMMEGRAVRETSTPYDWVIQNYAAVDDAIGYAVSINGFPLYILNFPTARQSLCFNYATQQWGKWGYWDTVKALYQRYRGMSYCYAKAWNLHLIGDNQTGKVYVTRRGLYTDNGNPIRSLIRTGHVSHGAEFTKRSDIIRLRCKRGQGNSAIANPQVSYRMRRNGGANWGNERIKSLGRVGDHELHLDWRRNGIYKTAQHEFVHSDATDFVVTKAQELLTVLGR